MEIINVPKIITPNQRTLNNIKSAIGKYPNDFKAYKDFFDFNRTAMVSELGGKKQTFEENLWLRGQIYDAFARTKSKNPAEAIKFYELLRQNYLYMAQDDFSSYMTYLEWERKPNERFYQPRAQIMKPLIQGIQQLVDGELDELFLSMPPRVGKALANNTPILTPGGWKKHGDLKVGDKVFCPDGGTATIIRLSPKCQMTHRVTMTDGSTFDCHFRHEWRVWDRSCQKERVLEVQKLLTYNLESGEANKRKHRYRFQLLQNAALEGEEKELPVKPYTLGAWLGDGTNVRPRLSNDKNDMAIRDAIIEEGYELGHVYVHKTTGVIMNDFKGLRADLNKIGMCKSRETTVKHIPDIYLTASKKQRLELLAGLLDTDGCLRKSEHRYDFCTTEEQLKNDVVTLVSTFGWRVCVVKHDTCTSSSGIHGKRDYYVVSFNPTEYIPCKLERKQLHEFSKYRRIAIKSIVPLEECVEGNCITLDRADGMYLAGNRLTPTHNTSMLMFLCTWLMGRNSEASNLYSAFSDIITNAFYRGVLEVLTDPTTYLWKDVFPENNIAETNAKDETINIDRKKRYPSLTCRSLYGTLNGACDCNGFLISDDLIGGIEEALNKDRLVSAWTKVDNNLIPRAKQSAKLLWCGTRWSQSDPAGLRMNVLLTDYRFKDRRFKIINLPALNEKGESNFNYKYGVGFSTDYYHQRKASFEKNDDLASWCAQYMGEPIERAGTLFEPTEMKYFNGDLPDESTLIRKFMAVDPAFGGGDYTAAPICYQFEDGVYVVDVVYSNASKKFTQPLLANKIVEWELKAVRFEANASTAAFKEKVEEMVHEKGYKCNITYKAAPTNVAKEVRIFDKAPEIREFYFLEGAKRSKEYDQFMTNVFSFQINGRNKHDDACDSLAMAVEMMESSGQNVRVMRRKF